MPPHRLPLPFVLQKLASVFVSFSVENFLRHQMQIHRRESHDSLTGEEGREGSCAPRQHPTVMSSLFT